jgi:hypothetical protein
MGQTLSEPIIKKDTSSGENSHLWFGLSCMQGWRLCRRKIITYNSHGRCSYICLEDEE